MSGLHTDTALLSPPKNMALNQGNPLVWKGLLWDQPNTRLSKISKATINMEQFRKMLKEVPEPDQEIPQKMRNRDRKCVVCCKLLCVLTSTTPFWFKLGPRNELTEAICIFHTPLILHSIAARLIPTHIKTLEPITLDPNSEIHISRHHSAMSLRIFQDGFINCSFQLVQKRNGNIPEGYGKVINPRWVDMKVLQSWKRCCQMDHGDNCYSLLVNAVPHLFKKRPQLLIDTWRMRLTEAAEDYPYVALSYVWGNCTNFRTLKQNLGHLRQDQSLKRAILESQIPKTVLHAIYLVDLLKERYLWVDALCIVHDDELSKYQQIQDMASIYANASLTIVAASGDHGDYGIHGIHGVSEPRDCQQYIFKLDRGQIRIVDLPWPLIEETTWFSRGWTYQEWLFSPRKLIFGDKRVRWECNRNQWQEDVDHISNPEAAPYPTGSADMSSIIESLSKIWPDTVEYATIVRFYNTRKFTNEEDILSAFAGMTSILASKFDGGFLYGLPEMFFDISLPWIPYEEVKRRVPRKLTAQWLQGSQLPSWSWMGWCGQIDPWSWLSAKNFYLNRTIGTVWIFQTVKWYTGIYSSIGKARREIIPSGNKYWGILQDDDIPLPWTRHIKPDGIVIYKLPRDPDSEFNYPVPIPNASTYPENPPQTPLLFFSTLRARFHVEQFAKSFRPGLTLRGRDGSWIGYLNLHDCQTMNKFPATSSRETIELIEISRGCAFNSGEAPQIDEWKMEERPKDGEFYDFYNVLFITWNDGVAYRKGCGRVLKDVWESADTEKIDVILG